MPTKQLYSAFERAFDHFNQALFDGTLPGCLLTMQRQPRMMGYASHQRWINGERKYVDELAINPEYFLGGTACEILQTLAHEMCHIWQYHFGRPGRRGYHNREWADKMESIGLMPSDSGSPGGRRTGEQMADYALDGGRFLTAAMELVESGFVIPWLDCQAVSHSPHVTAFDNAGQGIAIPGTQALMGRIDQVTFSISIDRPPGAAPVRKPASHVLQSSESGGISYVPNEAKPTRTKYKCEGCVTLLWGKPGLKIICGACKIDFLDTNAPAVKKSASEGESL